MPIERLASGRRRLVRREGKIRLRAPGPDAWRRRVERAERASCTRPPGVKYADRRRGRKRSDAASSASRVACQPFGAGITSRNPLSPESACPAVLPSWPRCSRWPVRSARSHPTPRASPFRQLALPAPNDVRTGSGRPGRGYWQQRVDYRIRATLDPDRHELSGRETIHYVNRSPDPLPYLWLFLEQNICEPGSVTNQLDQPPLVFLGSTFDFSCKGFAGASRWSTCASGSATCRRRCTAPRCGSIFPGRSLPGSSWISTSAGGSRCPTTARGGWAATARSTSSGQWYPRMAVYDDVRGWNHEPYIGGGEFYLEYGRFDVALTVPGELRRRRHRRAAQSDRGPDGRRSGRGWPAPGARRRRWPSSPPTRPGDARAHPAGAVGHAAPGGSRPTACATSRSAPRPTSAGTRAPIDGTLVHTLYRPSAPEWEEANRIVRDAVQYYSEQWYPLSLPAHHQHRRADRGDGVPHDHLRPSRAEPRGAPVGAGPRAGPSVGAR